MGRILGDCVGLRSSKNLKFFSIGVVALVLLSCNESNTDLNVNFGQASNEKYSVERKYSGVDIARNHCMTHDTILVGVGEATLALSCDYQAWFSKPHAGNSHSPINYDANKAMVTDSNGNLVIPVIGLSFSGNKVKAMREKHGQNMPLGIVGMQILPAVEASATGGRIGSNCKRLVHYACTLTWVMTDEKLRINVNVFLNELGENGELKTANIELGGKERVLYPKQTWPKLQADINAYIKSLIIKSNPD